MAYQEGDTSPPHTNVHNDVRTQLDQLSTEFEIPVVLPPVVGLGDVGHVDHHNLLTTALAELSKHECEEGLPGLGGWATITEVTGVYTPHRYNDGPGGVGGTDWVAYEFTDDGTVTTSDGLVDTLVCAGGTSAYDDGGGTRNAGNGGNVSFGIEHVQGKSHPVQVGKAGTTHSGQDSTGKISQFDDVAVGAIGNPGGRINKDGIGALLTGAFNGITGVPDDIDGVTSSITGTSAEYGRGGVRGGGNGPNGTHGWGGYSGTPGNTGNPTAGVVIVRVPSSHAQGVAENFHGWDSFALVTDGVVTDVTRVPDNEPHTLDAEWLPCPTDVQPGWDHTDGEFTPPPAPTRDDLIAELKERIKELQKDTK